MSMTIPRKAMTHTVAFFSLFLGDLAENLRGKVLFPFVYKENMRNKILHAKSQNWED